jgi:hypothetical protein
MELPERDPYESEKDYYWSLTSQQREQYDRERAEWLASIDVEQLARDRVAIAEEHEVGLTGYHDTMVEIAKAQIEGRAIYVAPGWKVYDEDEARELGLLDWIERES